MDFIQRGSSGHGSASDFRSFPGVYHVRDARDCSR